MAMPGEKIVFEASGGVQLAGRLDHGAPPIQAAALFAHCFTCTKDVLAASRISGRLAQAGITTLRFDFTGLGHSEGDFANTNFTSNIEDLVAAADHLRARGAPPRLLIGHSLGGAAVIAAAARIPEVVCVATIGAPYDPSHVLRQLGDRREEIERSGEAEVVLSGHAFRIRDQFIRDVSEHNLTRALNDLRRALLVFHSPIDDTVGIDNAARIFQAARHPKSFISLDGADHLLRRKSDAVFVAEVIAAWMSREAGAAI
jgi:putative redox protein